MQTLLFIAILFLFAVFGTLLFLKNKNNRLHNLEQGICPDCNASPSEFVDQDTLKLIIKKPIKSQLLKKHNCSEVADIQYHCKECGLKEVHTKNSAGCSF